jgi:hypothetical protein
MQEAAGRQPCSCCAQCCPPEPGRWRHSTTSRCSRQRGRRPEARQSEVPCTLPQATGHRCCCGMSTGRKPDYHPFRAAMSRMEENWDYERLPRALPKLLTRSHLVGSRAPKGPRMPVAWYDNRGLTDARVPRTSAQRLMLPGGSLRRSRKRNTASPERLAVPAGEPWRIRTSDPLLKRQLLCLTELTAHGSILPSAPRFGKHRRRAGSPHPSWLRL